MITIVLISPDEQSSCRAVTHEYRPLKFRYFSLKLPLRFIGAVLCSVEGFQCRFLGKYNFISGGRAKIVCADGSHGYINEAPYNRILVSASAEEIPKELKKQLAVGGRLVIPIKNSIWMIEKKSDKIFQEVEYPGFAFVPLIKN